MSITRSDGSLCWAYLRENFEDHDLAHFAVETVLGFKDAFFGLIDLGYEIGDFEDPDQALDSMARAIASRCHLTAVVVEDRALRSGASAGRYPSLGDHGERNVFAIGRGDAARAANVAERRRTARRSRLRDVGFEVRDALEMLPSHRLATG